MSDALKELCRLLADARVTFDSGRNISHPCTFCGTPAAPYHELFTIGRYLNGDDLTRPVCVDCIPIVEARKAEATKHGGGGSADG